MFERETRREKILEARNRELKLKKAKAAGEHDEGEVTKKTQLNTFKNSFIINRLIFSRRKRMKK